MDKNVLALVPVALLAGSLYWNWQQVQLVDQQQKKIEDLQTRMAGSRTPTMEMQAKCAAQAKKSFEESGWNKGLPSLNPEPTQMDDSNSKLTEYTDHYSFKLNKCFIEVSAPMQAQAGSSTLWTYKFLWDAYEGRSYAAYSWHTVEGKKYWEVPPFQCEMHPDGTDGSLQLCTSEAEFDAFVAKYMGDEQ